MPQPDHITGLDIVPDEAELSDDIKAIYDACREKLGFLPNVIQALAARPEKLKTFFAHRNELMLGDSQLSVLEREMIAVVVSSANHCFYCLVAHGAAVRQLSEDPQLGEMLVMNYRVAPLAPRQRAMLDFAWKLTKTPEAIEDTDRAALRDAAFSDEEIFDIADVAGFFNMTNRLASGIDMIPNAHFHGAAR